MPIVALCMHVLGILARIHAGSLIHVHQDRNVSLKTLYLFVPWFASVLMDFTLETMASVFKLLLYLSVLFMLTVATLNSVTQVLALMLVASSNVVRMRSARPEIIAFHVLAHLVTQEMLELHATQSLPILWMSLLAVALIQSALIMLPASTKHVATHVLSLILALPMLSAR